MRRRLRPFAAFIGSLLLAATADGPVTAHGFDERTTHRLLTDLAARRSRLDQTLKDELGLLRGLDTTLTAMDGRSQSLLNWLLSGAENEDVPPCRASNHFHNPLRPYAQARVTDQPLIDGFCRNFEPIRSSVVWGTRFVSPTERGPVTRNPFDWDAARASYLGALTRATPAERERALAQLFETLGHVAHLIQDLAVPAHARNNFNSHLGFSTERITEDGFEQFVRINPSMVAAAAPTEVDIARRFVTRFWDTDRYTGANPSSDSDQGLAEYTNANFVSLNTILTDGLAASDPYFHPYPRLSSTSADVLFGKDASVARPVRAEDGRVDTGLYIDKIRDGETITTFLRAGYLAGDLIDRAPPGTPKQLVLQLDDEVYRSHAAKLVPMALGYSKALLDYFFRGRLDVDLLQADPFDPSIVHVRGTNTSTDTLLGGSLTLWADDPDGRRVPATLLDPTATVTAGPNASLESARFRLPAGAERIVAVYTGLLGEEGPVPDGPGAVIGKVLGGVRVEEVFVLGERWALRTPKQLVLLADADGPLTIERYEDVRWGDGDSTLVARTPFGPGQPNAVVAYVVRRARDLDPPDPDATDPLAIVGRETADGFVATLSPGASVALPPAIPLGTTVTIEHTLTYRQQLLSYDIVAVHRFVPAIPGSETVGTYVFEREEFSPFKVLALPSASHSYSERLDLTLDPARYQAAAQAATSYRWTFADLTVTADGRILALVRVDVAPPPFALRARLNQPVFGYDLEGNLVRYRSCVDPFHCFDESGVVIREYPALTTWALVDLTARQTLISTAAPEVRFTGSQAVEAPRWAGEAAVGPDAFIYAFAFERRLGGPRATPPDGDERIAVGVMRRLTDDGRTADVAGGITLVAGREQQATGTLRGDLAGPLAAQGMLGPAPSQGGGGTSEELFGALGLPGGARLSVTVPASGVSQRDVELVNAQRVRPAAGAERLVLQADGGVGTADATALLAWDAVGGQARVSELFTFASGEFVGVDLGPATTAAVLVHASGRGGGYLVSVDGSQPTRFLADPSALYGFTLLDRRLLYSLDTLRFHRADTLAPTALPARLVTVDGNPFGDYHAIRVP